jgi:hypothetical protein
MQNIKQANNYNFKKYTNLEIYKFDSYKKNLN